MTATTISLTGGGGLAATEVVSDLLRFVLEARPEGDDRPMPYAAEGCKWRHYPEAISGFGGGAMLSAGKNPSAQVFDDGTGTGIDPEYVEAFDRLNGLIFAARGCGALPDTELEALRAALARSINQGIYPATPARVWNKATRYYEPGPAGFYCIVEDRPTRGQVRAWLAGLATVLGQRCTDSQLEALAAVVAQPLTTPAAPKAAGLSWVVLVGLAAVGVLLFGWLR